MSHLWHISEPNLAELNSKTALWNIKVQATGTEPQTLTQISYCESATSRNTPYHLHLLMQGIALSLWQQDKTKSIEDGFRLKKCVRLTTYSESVPPLKINATVASPVWMWWKQHEPEEWQRARRYAGTTLWWLCHSLQMQWDYFHSSQPCHRSPPSGRGAWKGVDHRLWPRFLPGSHPNPKPRRKTPFPTCRWNTA